MHYATRAFPHSSQRQHVARLAGWQPVRERRHAITCHVMDAAPSLAKVAE
jgi:hypothetical protein